MKFKKFQISLISIPLLVSCAESVDESLAKQPENESIPSTVRTIEDALDVAERYSAMPNDKSRSVRKVDATNVKTVKSHRGRSSEDVLYYVVNYEDNQGFAVVGAPKCVPELLAITESGQYGSAENTNNDSFHYVMEATELYVQSKIGVGGGTGDSGPVDFDLYIIEDTVPLQNRLGHM